MNNKLFILLLILLSFNRASAYEINYETKTFDEIKFTPQLNFQGTYNADFNNENSNFTYPFALEAGGGMQFGEAENKIKATISLTRNVDEFDNKFLGRLSDVYYERKLNKNHRILIGNSRIPIGMEGSKSRYNLMFAKRAQIASKFGNAKAAGVRFKGEIHKIDYDIGGYSSTRFLQDIGDGAEFAGWINYKPYKDTEHIFKDLKIGAGINAGYRDDDYTVAGIGGEWKYKNFLINTEYAYANGSNASEYNQNKSQGLYTTAAYNFTDKFQAAIRYDIFDDDINKSDDTVQKYTAGLNYYVIGQKLKFSLNYTYTQNPKNADDKNSIYFMTQILL